MGISKKKIVFPVLVFIVGMLVLGSVVYNIGVWKQNERRINAKLNATTYAQRMQGQINDGVTVTDTLKEILVSNGGQIHGFDKIANDLMEDTIQSIQLAPDGVVTDIYPEKDNEAGKIDLLHDSDRGAFCQYAIDHKLTVIQGPFRLKQGGKGIAVRNPVFLEKDGKEEFWGFTIVIIRVPEVFLDSVQALTGFGYNYRLLKTTAPWENTYEEVYNSGGDLVHPVAYTFDLGGESWKLEVTPKSGWVKNRLSTAAMWGGGMIVLLLTILTAVALGLDESRKRLKKMAVVDALTGIYNRSGFDEQVEKHLKAYPQEPGVGITFDVDDFKSINDTYGHAAGDHALEQVASGMWECFPKQAVLGRSGGDEFCIFLPFMTCMQAKEMIETFATMSWKFVYKGKKYPFTISLGYAEYPKQAKDIESLMHYADIALYEVKARGKRGCQVYQPGLQEKRTQLGFSMREVSENLPGAFLIYKADPADDYILFANHELIRLAGCEDLEDFFAHTRRHFRNLIKPEEQQQVEENIWTQLRMKQGKVNDYVSFSMLKKDGTYRKVFDHGRIVENKYYGNVFYVLIMDQESVMRHYL